MTTTSRSASSTLIKIALVTLLAVATAAHAQQPGPGGPQGFQGAPGGHPGIVREHVKARLLEARQRGPEGGKLSEAILLSPRVCEKLGLSEEQTAKIKATRLNGEKQAITLEAQARIAELDLKQLLEQNRPDQAKVLAQVDNVSRAKAALAKVKVQQHLAIRAILTDPQIEKIKTFIQERGTKRGAPGRGGRRGGFGRGEFGQGGPQACIGGCGMPGMPGKGGMPGRFGHGGMRGGFGRGQFGQGGPQAGIGGADMPGMPGMSGMPGRFGQGGPQAGFGRGGFGRGGFGHGGFGPQGMNPQAPAPNGPRPEGVTASPAPNGPRPEAGKPAIAPNESRRERGGIDRPGRPEGRGMDDVNTSGPDRLRQMRERLQDRRNQEFGAQPGSRDGQRGPRDGKPELKDKPRGPRDGAAAPVPPRPEASRPGDRPADAI